MTRRRELAGIAVVVATLTWSNSPILGQAPMGTAFSYQGNLTQRTCVGGSNHGDVCTVDPECPDGTCAETPANGEFDFQFKLCDDTLAQCEVAGSPVVDQIENHPVEGGLFTIGIDFGADVIDGTARWLEIGVRDGAGVDPDPFAILSPRQELTPAPHALALPGLWTQQNGPNDTPNLIGGFNGNIVEPGIHGATIGGGGTSASPNRVLDNFGTIGGGSNNKVGNDDGDACFATVSGGGFNQGTDVYATVGGGEINLASGAGSTVGGGRKNQASGQDATVAGGFINVAFEDWCTVAGGIANIASGQYAAIGGGLGNVADADFATIGGGGNTAGLALGSANRVIDDFGTISGGGNNRAGSDDADTTTDPFATIGGGEANLAGAAHSTVGGGQSNRVLGVYGTIAGGGRSDPLDELTGNNVFDDYGAVGGGGNNETGTDDGDTTSATYATIAGGFQNIASGQLSVIGGGVVNTSSGSISTTGGGISNEAAGEGSTIGGGFFNRATEPWTTVGGGAGNIVTAKGGTIAGGGDDTVFGIGNFVNDDWGTIGGGGRNTVGTNDGDPTNSAYATVSGGLSNLALGASSTVGGGTDNAATAIQSMVGGGRLNLATAGHATVSGGGSNEASGLYSTVPGGRTNDAVGAYSLAAGRRANANDDGSFVWADSNDFDFPSTAADEFSARSTGGVRFVSAIDGAGVPTAGVKLDPGDNAWSVLSDRSAKENFAPVDADDVLERLSQIPITRWNYKTQDASRKHIGPMAQDFHAAFRLSPDDRYLSPIDTDGVALLSIQGLYRMTQDKDAEIADLRTKNEDLAERIAALETLVVTRLFAEQGGAR